MAYLTTPPERNYPNLLEKREEKRREKEVRLVHFSLVFLLYFFKVTPQVVKHAQKGSAQKRVEKLKRIGYKNCNV